MLKPVHPFAITSTWDPLSLLLYQAHWVDTDHCPEWPLLVSPIASSIGDALQDEEKGKMNKDTSFELLDTFYEAGGNFIDTTSVCQQETLEEFIGEWMESRGIRDQVGIATKYAFNYKLGDRAIKQKIGYHGNNAKSLRLSVDMSLSKLRTSYIDILYVHFWDREPPVEELMKSLNALVQSGKVLYLGISDSPAWMVSQANQFARDHALTPFVIYQGSWNLLDRGIERDVVPMAREHGMAISPRNVLAVCELRSNPTETEREELGRNLELGRKRSEKERALTDALEKVAEESGLGYEQVPAIAIAWVMTKAPYVFPVVGTGRVEHLEQNIKAVDIRLSAEQVLFLESVHPLN